MDADIRSSVDVDAEVELGSSEETLEGVSNVSTKPFSNIVSLTLDKHKTIDVFQRSNNNTISVITRMCLFSKGQVITCRTRDSVELELLDSINMNTVFTFDLHRRIQNVQFIPTSMDIALFDRNRVAVAMTGTFVKDMIPEEVNSIHLIKVSPRVEISPEIKLKYTCEKINCFNNKIYCYSPDLNRSRFVACPGIEILAMNGELLKTIQLFDKVSCFCPTKDGDIIYFGDFSVKCVTTDNIEVFSRPTNGGPQCAISDKEGNIIILNSGNVELTNPDGSQCRVLLDINSMEITDENLRQFRCYAVKKEDITRQPMSICFSDDYKKFLVAVNFRCTRNVENSYAIIQKDFLCIYMYKIQYSK